MLVEVTDIGYGTGPAGEASEHLAARNGIPGSGLGLVGMRERVAVLGGALEAGRRIEGGWQVRATIPLARELAE